MHTPVAKGDFSLLYDMLQHTHCQHTAWRTVGRLLTLRVHGSGQRTETRRIAGARSQPHNGSIRTGNSASWYAQQVRLESLPHSNAVHVEGQVARKVQFFPVFFRRWPYTYRGSPSTQRDAVMPAIGCASLAPGIACFRNAGRRVDRKSFHQFLRFLVKAGVSKVACPKFLLSPLLCYLHHAFTSPDRKSLKVNRFLRRARTCV